MKVVADAVTCSTPLATAMSEARTGQRFFLDAVD
jgi:hypothetical protein